MQIAIESTDQITNIDGVPVRVWKGTTEKGVACHVFVHRIAVANVDDQSQFSEELQEMTPPDKCRAIPLRHIL